MIEMNKNTSPDKKSLKARESNAAKFLCVVLALITVFVSIVCVAVHSNNKKLIAAQTSAAGGDTVPSAKPVDATQNNNSVKPVEKTTEPVSVTETQPPVTHNTAQPGTIENPTIITIDEENWHLTLVNSGYRIPDTYSPDLVYVCGSGERLDRKVAEHYEEMYNAALKDGVTLTPCSGYRSYET